MRLLGGRAGLGLRRDSEDYRRECRMRPLRHGFRIVYRAARGVGVAGLLLVSILALLVIPTRWLILSQHFSGVAGKGHGYDFMNTLVLEWLFSIRLGSETVFTVFFLNYYSQDQKTRAGKYSPNISNAVALHLDHLCLTHC